MGRLVHAHLFARYSAIRIGDITLTNKSGIKVLIRHDIWSQKASFPRYSWRQTELVTLQKIAPFA